MILYLAPLFLQSQLFKRMSNEILKHKQKDIKHNWVNSSSFLFYIQVFCILAFILGGCFQLYKHSYEGKPDVEVPDNTLYTPKYK
jgi:hypothetical protein